MTIELFDSVVLTHPVEEKHLPKGARGAVVEVYGDHEAYAVEFMDGTRTIALMTLSPEDVKLVHKHIPVNTYAATDS